MRRLAILSLILAACGPVTTIELEQRSTALLPNLAGTTVAVDDISGRDVLPGPNNGFDRGDAGSAENLRVIRDGVVLAVEPDARIFTRLRFEVDGARFGLRVEEFEIHTFTAPDTVTLLLFDDN